ncbi:MAG: hypothetical protein KAW01_05320, partial [Deltaproteobacteria bacterium]|nr:hypothetical protein [Deltaproteobacteria bacterium]
QSSPLVFVTSHKKSLPEMKWQATQRTGTGQSCQPDSQMTIRLCMTYRLSPSMIGDPSGFIAVRGLCSGPQ